MEAFDLLWACDVCQPGDVGLRIAQEVRCASMFGYRCGLLHLPSLSQTGPVHAEIRRCVRKGGADVVKPGQKGRAGLLIVHPSGVRPDALHACLRVLAADRAVVVVSRIADRDLVGIDRLLSDAIGVVSWAPANPWIRAVMARKFPTFTTESNDWGCVVASEFGSAAADQPVKRLAWIGADKDPPQAPTHTDEGLEIVQLSRTAEQKERGQHRASASLETSDPAIERELRRIDALACFPSDLTDAPDGLIAAALAAGKVVLLPRPAERQYGKGPIYCTARQVLPRLKALRKNIAALKAARRAARAGAARQYSPDLFRARIEALAGKPQNPYLATRGNKSQKSARALFVAGDADHDCVGRLLSVARRCHNNLIPVFVTMTPDPSLIEQFGYVAEYVSGPEITSSSPDVHDDWQRLELEQLIEAYAADLVVLDASEPSPSLVQGLASHGECKLVWISPALEAACRPNADYAGELFDFVLRAGDLPAAGATSSRGNPTELNPLRLLEEEHILTRGEAASALGIDAAKPALLIRLTGKDARDALSAAEAILDPLGRPPNLQIVVSVDTGGRALQPLCAQGITCVSGYPIARYRAAFDFAVTDPTYAGFHEAISLEWPTIFLIDDVSQPGQVQRAEYAEREGAALSLHRRHLSALSAMVKILLAERARAHLAINCRRIKLPNGADQAAKIISELVQ